MRMFDKVTIIGVGLIGGSIGLAIKKRKLAREVVGVFRRRATLNKALHRKAVDRGVMDLAIGVNGADLVIVASPVYSIPSLVNEAIRAAKPGAVITDAGSTKRWIVSSIESDMTKRHDVHFVGSHPMAGSDKTSVAYARDDLVKGAACIETKPSHTDNEAVAKIVSFWKSIGGKVSVMSPAAHDARVPMISHLPHMVAFGLAGSVEPGDLKFAAEGFKDTTRVASSDPALWADIFLTNKSEVKKAGYLFIKNFKKLLAAVNSGDRRKLVSLLGQAKSKRDARYAKNG